MATTLLVGTRKGLMILREGGDGAAWTVEGPHCGAWPINHAIADADGTVWAGGGNAWFGPAVWRLRDGEWTHSSAGLSYGDGRDPVVSVWCLAQGPGGLYAGVEPAGLFLSRDDGESWSEVRALSDHPSRAEWQPGGGGLILHHVLPHPEDPGQIWVGISTAGVFYSGDGGATWEPRNHGTRIDYAPEGQRHPEVGQCVHALAMGGGSPDRLYQQNHFGIFRSDDGGRRWESIEAGLPSTFGFPAAGHPRDRDTLFLFPLNGDQAGRFAPEGRAAVWRTRDGGATWQDLRRGLPQENAFLTVLRQAMATDRRDPLGVYFGSTSGAVFASRDEGESWRAIARDLPAIASVEVAPA